MAENENQGAPIGQPTQSGQETRNGNTQERRRDRRERERAERDQEREDRRARLAEFSVIDPFTVEFGDQKNSGQITLDTLLLRLRGAWLNGNFAKRGNYLPQSQLRHGDIMGQRLYLNTRQMKVRIYDPYSDDQKALDHLNKQLNSGEVTIRPAGGFKFKVEDEILLDLDEHQMKSLLLELARKHHVPEDIRTVQAVDQGVIPTEQQIEDLNLPGFELYDPWSQNPRRPRFKKDAAAWLDKMDRQPA